MEVVPRKVWVVDNGRAKVAFSFFEKALESVPDGKSFRVIGDNGEIIQQGTKCGLVRYNYPF